MIFKAVLLLQIDRIIEGAPLAGVCKSIAECMLGSEETSQESNEGRKKIIQKFNNVRT